ncbi:MAG: response regulator [Pseudomonadota bacterium]|nr:response regulator [Pseudomonadota bacterium]
MPSPSLPRILLVEDDPTSRAFLMAAAAAVPAEVDSADSVSTALALANAQDYDLWLFDAHLPDGSGCDLLQRLRLRHPHTPAVAHTATQEAATRGALIAAGFAEVVIKPLPAATLRATIRRILGLPDGERASTRAGDSDGTPVWDDEAAALALNGNHSHVQTLRELFLHELAQTGTRISEAARRGDLANAEHGLHKLRASCGFVGASRLAAAVHAWQQQPQQLELHQSFEQAVRDTLGEDQAGQAKD